MQTRPQNIGRKNTPLALLKKITTLAKEKKFKHEVVVGYCEERDTDFWDKLILTEKGLEEKGGYGNHPISPISPRRVRPSMELVVKYHLTEPELQRLIHRFTPRKAAE